MRPDTRAMGRGQGSVGSVIRFTLGKIVATPGAIAALLAASTGSWVLLQRHAQGDWGEVDEEDRRRNERAIVEGTFIRSVYRLPRTREIVWVVTEGNRRLTTLLLS